MKIPIITVAKNDWHVPFGSSNTMLTHILSWERIIVLGQYSLVAKIGMDTIDTTLFMKNSVAYSSSF
jgi:hypothetical protein